MGPLNVQELYASWRLTAALGEKTSQSNYGNSLGDWESVFGRCCARALLSLSLFLYAGNKEFVLLMAAVDATGTVRKLKAAIGNQYAQQTAGRGGAIGIQMVPSEWRAHSD